MRSVQALDRLEILRNKARLEDEVLRRITGDRQFRRQNQFGSLIGKSLIGGEDLCRKFPRRSPMVGLICAMPILMLLRQISRAEAGARFSRLTQWPTQTGYIFFVTGI